MEELEKVEKLRERANVTYDEAKDALRACNGDLLDAMVYLEKLGKVKAPEQASYSTKYTEAPKYKNVSKEVKFLDDRAMESFGEKVKRFGKKIWKIGNDNHVIITKKGEQFLDLPLWVAVIIFCAAWHILLILMLVSMFFGFEYRFEGKNDLSAANEVMEKVAEATQHVSRTFAEKEVDDLASKYDGMQQGPAANPYAQDPMGNSKRDDK